MKNNRLRGTGAVFRYTVQQHYKTMSVRVFLLILFILALAAFPLIRLTFGGDTEVEQTDITQLYLRNETTFAVDAEDIRADERYAALTVTEFAGSDDVLAELLAQNEHAAAAIIALDESGTAFTISGYYAEDGLIGSNDVMTLTHVLEDALHQSLLRSLSVTDAQITTLNSKAISQVQKVSEYGSVSNELDTGTHIFVNLFYSYFVLILSALAMSYIFQLCMEEKISKLVESLLVSVEPTALLVGKILAVTCFLFCGIGLITVGLVISYQFTKTLGDVSFIRKFVLTAFEFDPSALKLNLLYLLFCVCSVLVAYFICAFFSGIVGSCCSKMEDTQQASLAVVLFLMVGYLASAFAPMMESDTVNYILSLFPLTSIFVALPNLICGKIGITVYILSLILQIVTAVLLARAAGSTYRMMILYRGGVPKPKQLVQMFRDERAARKANTGKEDSHEA